MENNDKEIKKEIEIELVIARYNEKLEWLNKEPFCNYYHTIYNKGNDLNFCSNFKTLRTISLNNIGRESHTYLSHIILRYDTLPKLTIYLPGSLDKNLNKLEKAKYILNLFEKNNKHVSTMIGVYYKNGIQQELNEFKINYWCSKIKKEKYTNDNSVLELCKIRPFGNWHKHVFGDIDTHIISYGGVFSISKEDIIQHKKKRYVKLLKIFEIEKSSNPEVGHYFERSWESVFYPLGKNSQIYCSKY